MAQKNQTASLTKLPDLFWPIRRPSLFKCPFRNFPWHISMFDNSDEILGIKEYLWASLLLHSFRIIDTYLNMLEHWKTLHWILRCVNLEQHLKIIPENMIVCHCSKWSILEWFTHRRKVLSTQSILLSWWCFTFYGSHHDEI